MKQLNKSLLVTLGAVAVVILAFIFVGANTARPGPPAASKSAPANEQKGKPQSDTTTGSRESQAANGNANPASASKPAWQGSKSRTDSTVPDVGVVSVIRKSHQATVQGFGQVNPQFNLTLAADVSGRIEALASHFETGARFHKGDELARIDSTNYQQAVAAAKATLEAANVALEEERLQGKQALAEWQRSGLEGEPDSALVLREPQLAAAQATVDQAKSALAQAQRDLKFTHITVPFDSVVVSRDVQPGSYVQTGAQVAAVYATEFAEVAIPLSASQWRNLPAPATLSDSPWPVTITDMDQQNSWQGYVERIEQHLDTTSRQRSAIVRVDAPLDQPAPLYFGTYVNASIAGKVWQDVWQIPSSAISQKQEVWFVRENNTLDKFTPQLLFMQGESAFIAPETGMDNAKIVARPLNSYLVQTKVNPVEEKTDGHQ